jgi:hypothetical protein
MSFIHYTIYFNTFILVHIYIKKFMFLKTPTVIERSAKVDILVVPNVTCDVQ